MPTATEKKKRTLQKNLVKENWPNFLGGKAKSKPNDGVIINTSQGGESKILHLDLVLSWEHLPIFIQPLCI